MPKQFSATVGQQTVGGRVFKQSQIHRICWIPQSVLELLENRCPMPWKFGLNPLFYGIPQD